MSDRSLYYADFCWNHENREYHKGQVLSKDEYDYFLNLRHPVRNLNQHSDESNEGWFSKVQKYKDEKECRIDPIRRPEGARYFADGCWVTADDEVFHIGQQIFDFDFDFEYFVKEGRPVRDLNEHDDESNEAWCHKVDEAWKDKRIHADGGICLELYK